MGDPAGIGGELTLRAWQALRRHGPCFVALDDPCRLTALGGDVPIRQIASADAASAAFANALPVLPISLPAVPKPGRPDAANANAVIQSIERAAALCLSGETSGMVTNPINKAALYGAGFAYPGHTEFLATLTGASGRQIMMLASPELRVVPVTVHASLRNSIAMLTTEAIVAASQTTAEALQREFGIARPRLAVAGLNPHAGGRARWATKRARSSDPRLRCCANSASMYRGPGRRIRCSPRGGAAATMRRSACIMIRH